MVSRSVSRAGRVLLCLALFAMALASPIPGTVETTHADGAGSWDTP
ncbi:MAG: hypothetical protein AB7R89_21530 [Dehalococcoidia bacterium]